ncbi:MAG TPA: prenyltransferase/squalene oxidase repeat-containing protein [Verrucomicrobiae bacterium]|nr:prenyltransferase/squalene oxidase repeat-containing protein [Verrucomicrobiae bacterium]
MEDPWINLEILIRDALEKTSDALLSFQNSEGVWAGELSSSALSTATAIVALELMGRSASGTESDLRECIEKGRRWLAGNANPDGGWGDTVKSRSNVSTTTLAWAALGMGPGDPQTLTATERAEIWLRGRAGSLEPERLASHILERYGTDRTFSAPILTHCALAGRLGNGLAAWRHVIPLPFELAALPAQWFGALRLPVVSYALPALIAIGYCRHFHAPSSNPLIRLIRSGVTQKVFRVLDSIQPTNGGFLEAIPLTSFVVMSLAGSGMAAHPVARRGVQFILDSVQPDGSWKIDTNLSTFVTSLAAHALSGIDGGLSEAQRGRIQDWLLRQQYRRRHPYTNAAPGGWAWTPLPGGVPDADDTSGALVALKAMQTDAQPLIDSAKAAVVWLLNLQNSDGGVPTFCRGWGKLPFDRSSADITAHALRGWAAWKGSMDSQTRGRVSLAMKRAAGFLERTQEPQGSWYPLWFGNEFEADEINRVYGTSRVLLALAETRFSPGALKTGAHWLINVQRPDGGWNGGNGSGPSSTEETALALECLCAIAQSHPELGTDLAVPVRRGLARLLASVADGSWTDPAPIGFYFAKLWYYEKLYPVVFTVAALARAAQLHLTHPQLLRTPP